MQEIEIKFKVNDLEKIKNRLLELGSVFSEELNQVDTVFVPDINDTSNGKDKVFIRVRKVNEKIELNLKKQSSKLMQSKEIEFEVNDYESAKDFLETLELVEWVTVEKKRVTTKYKNFNICIDDVKRLGQFIEIEIVTPEENNTEYFEREILSVAKELGINTEARINNFYDTMIRDLDKSEKVLQSH